MLEDADGGVAGAEAVVQAGVDVPGIGDAALDEVESLPPQGELEAVADEAGSGLLEDDGLAIEGLEQLFGELEHVIGSVAAPPQSSKNGTMWAGLNGCVTMMRSLYLPAFSARTSGTNDELTEQMALILGQVSSIRA